MRETFLIVLGVLAATAAGALIWRRHAPRSFWLLVVFPVKAVHLYLTWLHVASGCGLTTKRRRWRWSLDAMPVAGAMARTAATVKHRRKLRRVEVEHAPRLGLVRPGPLGWRVRVKLHHGQVPADYSRAAEQLAHAWRVHGVRIAGSSPGRVWLVATRADPLTTVSIPGEAWELLRVTLGRLETGAPRTGHRKR